ncbi:hypothetical protein BSKO_03628 [Bryopsis sp. KO-2023]|nr:hypothetical protein BSKO_03628 [Bryopsis sp. KO-2023]
MKHSPKTHNGFIRVICHCPSIETCILVAEGEDPLASKFIVQIAAIGRVTPDCVSLYVPLVKGGKERYRVFPNTPLVDLEDGTSLSAIISYPGSGLTLRDYGPDDPEHPDNLKRRDVVIAGRRTSKRRRNVGVVGHGSESESDSESEDEGTKLIEDLPDSMQAARPTQAAGPAQTVVFKRGTSVDDVEEAVVLEPAVQPTPSDSRTSDSDSDSDEEAEQGGRNPLLDGENILIKLLEVGGGQVDAPTTEQANDQVSEEIKVIDVQELVGQEWESFDEVPFATLKEVALWRLPEVRKVSLRMLRLYSCREKNENVRCYSWKDPQPPWWPTDVPYCKPNGKVAWERVLEALCREYGK